VRPYMTLDNKIDGAVLVLVDIDDLKKHEREIAAARAYAEAIIETVREPLIVLDENLRVQTANKSFYQNFQVAREEVENRFIYELGDRQWDIPALRKLLETILAENNQFQDFEVVHDFPGIGSRTMLLNARRLARDGYHAQSILLAFEDSLSFPFSRPLMATSPGFFPLLKLPSRSSWPSAVAPLLVAQQSISASGISGKFF